MAGFGINDAGQVVGGTNNTAGLITPEDCDGDGDLDWFCDDGQGGNSLIVDLGTLFPGDWEACGEAVNESGQVVGYSAGEDVQAFIWDAFNGMVALGTLGGDESYSWAHDINASGQVVGVATSDDSLPEYNYYYRHAFVWENGAMVDLGTLGGDFSVAGDINDLGQIVGSAEDRRGNTLPFLYSDGAMSSLDPLLPEGSAHSLNNAAQVGGTSIKSSGGRPTGQHTRTATFWENGVAMAITDLVDTDIGYSAFAEDINNSGQFVTYGGYILHPLP